eukprot:gene2010-3013_t
MAVLRVYAGGTVLYFPLTRFRTALLCSVVALTMIFMGLRNQGHYTASENVPDESTSGGESIGGEQPPMLEHPTTHKRSAIRGKDRRGSVSNGAVPFDSHVPPYGDADQTSLNFTREGSQSPLPPCLSEQHYATDTKGKPYMWQEDKQEYLSVTLPGWLTKVVPDMGKTATIFAVLCGENWHHMTHTTNHFKRLHIAETGQSFSMLGKGKGLAITGSTGVVFLLWLCQLDPKRLMIVPRLADPVNEIISASISMPCADVCPPTVPLVTPSPDITFWLRLMDSSDPNFASVRYYLAWLQQTQTATYAVNYCKALVDPMFTTFQSAWTLRRPIEYGLSECVEYTSPDTSVVVMANVITPVWPRAPKFARSVLEQARIKQVRRLSVIVPGDEVCERWHGPNSGQVDILIRNYWYDPLFKRYLGPTHRAVDHTIEVAAQLYLPLGISHRFPLTYQHELLPHSEQKYLFNMVGSLSTNKLRQSLASFLKDLSGRKDWGIPGLGRAGLKVFEHYNSQWNRDYSAERGYLPPLELKQVLLRSLYTLVPEGGSPETFRLYEALECGSIPILKSVDPFIRTGSNRFCGDPLWPY